MRFINSIFFKKGPFDNKNLNEKYQRLFCNSYKTFYNNMSLQERTRFDEFLKIDLQHSDLKEAISKDNFKCETQFFIYRFFEFHYNYLTDSPEILSIVFERKIGNNFIVLSVQNDGTILYFNDFEMFCDYNYLRSEIETEIRALFDFRICDFPNLKIKKKSFYKKQMNGIKLTFLTSHGKFEVSDNLKGCTQQQIDSISFTINVILKYLYQKGKINFL